LCVSRPVSDCACAIDVYWQATNRLRLKIHRLDLIVSFPSRFSCGVATFVASTGKLNPGTAAITTRSALPLAIEGEVAELNNHLIPLSSRRRHESSAWQDPFQFADSSGSRLNWPAGSFPFQPSRPSIRTTATHKLLYLNVY